MIHVTLPWPPSVNHYWFARGNRRFIGKKGVEFRQQVAEIIAENGEKMTGRLAIFVTLYPPNRIRRDIDNTQKAIFDSLQHAGCFEDDEQIDLLYVLRREVVPGGKAEVLVTSLETAPRLSIFP